MWPQKFEDRLLEWRDLRIEVADVPFDEALMRINDWWWRAPMTNHYLHWDDIKEWPDPWGLLADNIFCDLARSLGIVYTVLLVESFSDHPIEIIETRETNLVLVDDGKYILNWAPRQLLNIDSASIQVQRRANGEIFRHLLR